MARMWSCGFELGDPNIELVGPGTVIAETVTVRSGTYSAEVSGLSSGVSSHVVQTHVASGGGNGPYYVRAYVNFAVFPSAENAFLGLFQATVNTAWITVSSTGTLVLRDEDGAIGSPSSALSTGTWYRIELLFDGSPGAGSDVVRGYIDGTEFAGAATRSI